MTEKQWGGRRTGAGRPKPAEEHKRTTVYLTEREREQLRTIGEGNLIEGIRRLLASSVHRLVDHGGERVAPK